VGIAPPARLSFQEYLVSHPFVARRADALDRALRFLRNVSHIQAVVDALVTYGYSSSEHEFGWSLALELAGCRSCCPRVPEPASTEASREAIAAWCEMTLPRARAALRRLHPAVAERLFEGLDIDRADPLEAASLYLQRCAVLEHAADPASRDARQAALDTLHRRGITRAERDRAGALLEACRTPAASAKPWEPSPSCVDRVDRLEAWLDDWCTRAPSSGVATTRSASVSIHDPLIRLTPPGASP